MSIWTLAQPLVVALFGLVLNLLRVRVPQFQDRYMVPAIAVLSWVLQAVQAHVPGLAAGAGDVTLPSWVWGTAGAVAAHGLVKNALKPKTTQTKK